MDSDRRENVAGCLALLAVGLGAYWLTMWVCKVIGFPVGSEGRAIAATAIFLLCFWLGAKLMG